MGLAMLGQCSDQINTTWSFVASPCDFEHCPPFHLPPLGEKHLVPTHPGCLPSRDLGNAEDKRSSTPLESAHSHPTAEVSK